jgi:hypothetical protein
MNRLLTRDEHNKLHEDFFGEGACSEIDDTDLCLKVAVAQDAKTASLVYKEIREWLDDHKTDSEQWLGDLGVPFISLDDYRLLYEALKQGKSPIKGE